MLKYEDISKMLFKKYNIMNPPKRKHDETYINFMIRHRDYERRKIAIMEEAEDKVYGVDEPVPVLRDNENEIVYMKRLKEYIKRKKYKRTPIKPKETLLRYRPVLKTPLKQDGEGDLNYLERIKKGEEYNPNKNKFELNDIKPELKQKKGEPGTRWIERLHMEYYKSNKLKNKLILDIINYGTFRTNHPLLRLGEVKNYDMDKFYKFPYQFGKAICKYQFNLLKERFLTKNDVKNKIKIKYITDPVKLTTLLKYFLKKIGYELIKKDNKISIKLKSMVNLHN